MAEYCALSTQHAKPHLAFLAGIHLSYIDNIISKPNLKLTFCAWSLVTDSKQNSAHCIL